MVIDFLTRFSKRRSDLRCRGRLAREAEYARPQWMLNQYGRPGAISDSLDVRDADHDVTSRSTHENQPQ
jgi:hypothetical protein